LLKNKLRSALAGLVQSFSVKNQKSFAQERLESEIGQVEPRHRHQKHYLGQVGV